MICVITTWQASLICNFIFITKMKCRALQRLPFYPLGAFSFVYCLQYWILRHLHKYENAVLFPPVILFCRSVCAACFTHRCVVTSRSIFSLIIIWPKKVVCRFLIFCVIRGQICACFKIASFNLIAAHSWWGALSSRNITLLLLFVFWDCPGSK